MADAGDEFIVDKILDKRSRNGKIEYYLSWKVRNINRFYQYGATHIIKFDQTLLEV